MEIFIKKILMKLISEKIQKMLMIFFQFFIYSIIRQYWLKRLTVYYQNLSNTEILGIQKNFSEFLFPS